MGELLDAARALIAADLTEWADEDDTHFCAVCGAHVPTKDDDHRPDCALIRLKRAVAAEGGTDAA